MSGRSETPMKAFGILIVAAAVLGALVYFSMATRNATETTAPDGAPFSGPTEQPPQPPQNSNGDGRGDVETSESAGREITIEGGDYYFSPSRIIVSPGETLAVTFVNIGQIPHAYDIDELSLHTGVVSPGGSKTVTFTAPDESVSYRSYCSVPGHVERGMVGQIVVQ